MRCWESTSADTIHDISMSDCMNVCKCAPKNLNMSFLEYDPNRIAKVMSKRNKINLSIRELIAKKIRSMFHNIL